MVGHVGTTKIDRCAQGNRQKGRGPTCRSSLSGDRRERKALRKKFKRKQGSKILR